MVCPTPNVCKARSPTLHSAVGVDGLEVLDQVARGGLPASWAYRRL